jgi:hypothetical protein
VHPTTNRSAKSGRWAFCGKYKVIVDGELFLARRRTQCPWLGVLLTRIYRPDGDRAPHNHSRWFASWILRGGYTECVYGDPADLSSCEYREHRRWSWHVMPRSKAHRITEITGPLLTLVVTGRQVDGGSFDFWTPAGPVSKDVYG